MDVHERLIHYAAISAEDEVSRAAFNMNMISAATVHRRNRAVNWIDVVCVHLHCKFIDQIYDRLITLYTFIFLCWKQITSLTGCDIETKHTCIQIFDRYITSFFLEEKKPIENWKFVSLTAAAATLIGIKIHYSKKALTVESFPYFQAHDLVNCERLVLEKLDYSVDPCYSPICFMKYMLHLWPGHRSRHEELMQEATGLVDKFILSFESIQYSPMTIAVSALLLASLKLRIDSSDWLQNLPGQCYTSADASVDKCLESFRACSQTTCQTLSGMSSTNSPTTVTAIIDNKLTIKDIPTPSITPTAELLGTSCNDYGGGDQSSNMKDEITCSIPNKHCRNIGYTFAPIHCSSSQHSLDQLELKRPVPRTLESLSNCGEKKRIGEDIECNSSAKYRKIS